MVLKTKSITEEISPGDGLRICVMRIYNRQKHPEYKSVDEHNLSFAPSKELLDDYHKGLPWEDYVSRFNKEVLIPEAEKIRNLAALAMKKDITLLCFEDKPNNCHRRLLALACKMYQPQLELILK